MSKVAEFRKSNNNIEVSNFKEDSRAPLLNPTPAFHHAFHNFPDILMVQLILHCVILSFYVSRMKTPISLELE